MKAPAATPQPNDWLATRGVLAFYESGSPEITLHTGHTLQLRESKPWPWKITQVLAHGELDGLFLERLTVGTRKIIDSVPLAYFGAELVSEGDKPARAYWSQNVDFPAANSAEFVMFEIRNGSKAERTFRLFAEFLEVRA